MASRIVIEEECEHGNTRPCGKAGLAYSGGVVDYRCPGGSRRVLDPGSYVLIEKVDGEWPEWATYAARPFEVIRMDDGYNSLATRESTTILDALAGGEQP